jgi:hypothetical protein
MNTPAFPTKINTEHFSHPSTIYNTGMTLRDYFAAKAMQEFLDEVGSQSDQEWFDQIAKNAYRMADTMMKAREA